MTNDLAFEFTVDKAAKTVTIKREFDADLSLVWDAFTKAELLDQLGSAQTLPVRMDFKVWWPEILCDVKPRRDWPRGI